MYHIYIYISWGTYFVINVSIFFYNDTALKNWIRFDLKNGSKLIMCSVLTKVYKRIYRFGCFRLFCFN
jgi:hypothetical protein